MTPIKRKERLVHGQRIVLLLADLISWGVHVLATEKTKLELLDAVRLLSNSAHRDCSVRFCTV